MAARRGRSQARRNSGNGIPGWAWLVAGMALAAVLFLAWPTLVKKDSENFLRPRPNPEARPQQASDSDGGEATAVPPARTAPPATSPPSATAPQYDFYTLLPGKEVQMSDAEVAASARAEQTAQARAQKAADLLAGGNGDGKALAAQQQAGTAPPAIAAVPAQPKPLDENPAAPAKAPLPPPVTATTPAQAPSVAAAGDVHYLLQAGSYGASGDAEALKAKIAMLGLSARVEPADINGKMVYRVRMGPYGSASELAQAKAALSSGGLPAMAIKAQ